MKQLQSSAGAIGLALTGNGFDNRLFGGAGCDTLRGGAEADIDPGGGGADHIGLTGGLTIAQMTIDQSTDIGFGAGNDAIVSVTAMNEILLLATNVSFLDASDHHPGVGRHNARDRCAVGPQTRLRSPPEKGQLAPAALRACATTTRSARSGVTDLSDDGNPNDE